VSVVENRTRLLAALRELPKSFKWDFDEVYRVEHFPMRRGDKGDVLPLSRCGSVGCLIGLAVELGIIEIDEEALLLADDLSEALGINKHRGYDMMLNPSSYGVDHASEVTAEMVAERLEGLTS
jgi:hypothetical protein